MLADMQVVYKGLEVLAELAVTVLITMVAVETPMVQEQVKMA